jgi:hypothetical protein
VTGETPFNQQVRAELEAKVPSASFAYVAAGYHVQGGFSWIRSDIEGDPVLYSLAKAHGVNIEKDKKARLDLVDKAAAWIRRKRSRRQ